MTDMIVNIELVEEFERKCENPVLELQFNGKVGYGTAYYFLKEKKPPKRTTTMKKLAAGMKVDVGMLFLKSSQAAS